MITATIKQETAMPIIIPIWTIVEQLKLHSSDQYMNLLPRPPPPSPLSH